MIEYIPPIPLFDPPAYKGLPGGGMYRYIGKKPYRVEDNGKLYTLYSYSYFNDDNVLEKAREDLSKLTRKESRVFTMDLDSVRVAGGRRPSGDFWPMHIYGVFLYERTVSKGRLKAARKMVAKSKRRVRGQSQATKLFRVGR